MTRLNVPHPLPPKPPTVALCELAIAAGLTGHSVTLSFKGLPAPTLCQLCKYCMRYAGPNAVRNIYSQADARKLAKDSSAVRLVLVHAVRLCNLVSWTIQTSSVFGNGAAQPALFHCAGSGDAENDPGATLIIQGDSTEQAAVAQWLLTVGNDHPDWEAGGPVENIQAEPALEAALMAVRFPSAGAGGLRNRQVMDALLAGATLARAMQEVPVPPHLITSIEDYELVRRLVQARLVASADEAFDPLAADMVSRANVYIEVKCGEGNDNPFYGDFYAIDRRERPGRELVTRREVSDLGNIRSRMVRRLIEFLLRQPDGYERFRRMGLVRRPPELEAWRRTGVNTLVTHLRSWSAKQTRTHFEQLRRVGMITAERDHRNGPWRYTLPEDLTARSNAFRGLPAIQDRPAAPPAT